VKSEVTIIFLKKHLLVRSLELLLKSNKQHPAGEDSHGAENKTKVLSL